MAANNMYSNSTSSTTCDATVAIPFETWLGNPTSVCMTLVIAGRSCFGKSTLVENLLGLEHGSLSPSSDARSIKVYHRNAGNPGVELTIVEIPGLDKDSTNPNKEIAAVTDELQNVTKGGGVDLLLYCISIAPSARVAADIESKTINLLTAVLKPQIWERAVIAFTSADYVKDRHAKNPPSMANPALESVMKEYAQKFEEILKAANVGSFTVLPLYCVQDSTSERMRPLQEIPALPAGETLSAKLLPSMKWEEHLYSEMLTKCTLRAVPMLVNIGKNQLSKGDTILALASRFGLQMSVVTLAYFIATRCFGLSFVSTSKPAEILFAVFIGGTVAFLAERFGTRTSTWASSAHSIAQIRFQAEKKQH